MSAYEIFGTDDKGNLIHIWTYGRLEITPTFIRIGDYPEANHFCLYPVELTLSPRRSTQLGTSYNRLVL